MKFFKLSALLLFFIPLSIKSQVNLDYPFPVNYCNLVVEEQNIKMAYMDILPDNYNGKNALLLHGKNFCGFYWKQTIEFLKSAGYRVIVPDEIGWGKSSKPNIHYSFHMLANNTKQLLDSLGIKETVIIGHSMGGMLATRFALMYPSMVTKLILENPIGLEDYKTFIPYIPIEETYQKELKANFNSYLKLHKKYYPEWKPEYDIYVNSQAEPIFSDSFPQIAWTNALTYQMIYEQPVCYEFEKLTVKTLLIIGQEDRTVVGREKLSKEDALLYGLYPDLGKKARKEIKNSKLVELVGVGHIPHIQTPNLFKKAVMEFLNTI
jgi:pimeloyl-ACP methyl ester carboxylesterase